MINELQGHCKDITHLYLINIKKTIFSQTAIKHKHLLFLPTELFHAKQLVNDIDRFIFPIKLRSNYDFSGMKLKAVFLDRSITMETYNRFVCSSLKYSVLYNELAPRDTCLTGIFSSLRTERDFCKPQRSLNGLTRFLLFVYK